MSCACPGIAAPWQHRVPPVAVALEAGASSHRKEGGVWAHACTRTSVDKLRKLGFILQPG